MQPTGLSLAGPLPMAAVHRIHAASCRPACPRVCLSRRPSNHDFQCRVIDESAYKPASTGPVSRVWPYLAFSISPWYCVFLLCLWPFRLVFLVRIYTFAPSRVNSGLVENFNSSSQPLCPRQSLHPHVRVSARAPYFLPLEFHPYQEQRQEISRDSTVLLPRRPPRPLSRRV